MVGMVVARMVCSALALERWGDFFGCSVGGGGGKFYRGGVRGLR